MEEERENKSIHNNNNSSKEHDMLGAPVHSQVRKIKQEYSSSEKVIDWWPEQPHHQIKAAVHGRDITRQQQLLSRRSPLGLAGQPIFVGHS